MAKQDSQIDSHQAEDQTEGARHGNDGPAGASSMCNRRSRHGHNQEHFDSQGGIPAVGEIASIGGNDVPDSGQEGQDKSGPRDHCKPVGQCLGGLRPVALPQSRNHSRNSDLAADPYRGRYDVEEQSEAVQRDVEHAPDRNGYLVLWRIFGEHLDVPISAEMPYQKQFKTVSGKQMAYVDVGEGDPLVFLHGNPTSSYLWRNVMRPLEDLGRLIAPDLIGMGDSDKLDSSGPDAYTFVQHREYLDGLLDQLDLGSNVTLIIHDWGSALGFDWANRHRDSMRGIVYMEAIVKSMDWDDWPESARGIFQAMRGDGGEEMVLEKNFFVDRIFPASVLRDVDDEEMAVYRAPYLTPGEDRRPTLTWPRQIPLNGEPQDVVEIVDAYSEWLQTSDMPKLFVNADPGVILTGPQREFCRAWPNQSEVTVAGSHFIQEDSPDEIAESVRAWLLSSD